MKVFSYIKEIPLYNFSTDAEGNIINAELIGTDTVEITELTADSGKQFIRNADNSVLGDQITLGTDDSADNYSEI